MNTLINNGQGTLIGLAVGDALGRPVEFKSPSEIAGLYGNPDEEYPVNEMIGNGTYGKSAGTVTDDTDMMLCIARSLTSEKGFDGEDIAKRFLEWKASGPFDIGLMTSEAIDELQRGCDSQKAGKNVWARRSEGSNAGNGSLMRCAPHALAFHGSPTKIIEVSRQSSRITHYDARCQWACTLLNLVISRLVDNADTPVADVQDLIHGFDYTPPDELLRVLDDIVTGELDDGYLSNTGYVVHTFETALYHALEKDSFEDAVLSAVNMGGDADTLGAVTGAVAGARFGYQAIPTEWSTTLNNDILVELESYGEQLTEQSFK